MLLPRRVRWPFTLPAPVDRIDDEGAQVLAVEHQDVRGAGFGVEVHERADQDAEGDTQVVGQDRRRGHVLVVAGGGALARSCIEYILIITPFSS